MVATSSSTPALATLACTTRQAASQLAGLPSQERDRALEAIAESLESTTAEILAANEADCQAAAREGISQALLGRLQLGETKLQAAIAGVRDVRKLPDPVGQVQIHRELDTNLILKRVTCPLGVLGIVFEARPDALIQIVSLAIKSGNGAILKGGREATRSCQTLVKAIEQGLATTAVNPDAIQLLTTREEIQSLLALNDDIDLIVPRGSNAFVRYVQENTRIPVLGHADGICHLYIDRATDPGKAIAIALDAKIQYPSACNAIETLLVHRDIAPSFLPQVTAAFTSQGVELRGDEGVREFVPMAAATEADWSTEYSDLVLSIKIVDSLTDAIAHINTYGSKHTDAIVTEDEEAAAIFLSRVDAAGVFHNCSTRFADGFRYGFGAEVGISTQKMPPRGPVGLEGLVTYKYQLLGKGHLVATYAGAEAKSFSHRDLFSRE